LASRSYITEKHDYGKLTDTNTQAVHFLSITHRLSVRFSYALEKGEELMYMNITLSE